jgi:hypothetical protein
MVLHEAGVAALKADYPEAVKRRIFLACIGAVHGPRRCILCGQPGATTWVHVPAESLRVVAPVFDGIKPYWLCLAHNELDENAPEVLAALQKKGGKR